MRVLVTGASGFVGRELVSRLLREGQEVRAFVRDPARLGRLGVAAPAAGPAPSVVVGDALSGAGLAGALEGVGVAYYLIHSMERPRAGGPRSPFPERERRAAENFAAAAAAAGVGRIVYLGGPTAAWTPREGAANTCGPVKLSPHLHSREEVARVLRDGVPDVVTVRASIVIGAGSRSFRFLVRLVERMPVLALPAWHIHRTRPIDARDVIAMLAAAGRDERVAGRSLDVGGPDVLSYGEMLGRIADSMLVARPSFGMGVSATPLTARVAATIAAEDPEFALALMESLRDDLLPDGEDGGAHLRAAELLGVELHSFDSAVERSLREWESVERLAAR